MGIAKNFVSRYITIFFLNIVVYLHIYWDKKTVKKKTNNNKRHQSTIRFFNFGCFFNSVGTRLSFTKQLGVMATHVTCEIVVPPGHFTPTPHFKHTATLSITLFDTLCCFTLKYSHTLAFPLKNFIRSNSSSHFVAILFHFCYFR